MMSINGEIAITRHMARAINDFAGKEVIQKSEIGRTFFVGLEGDGQVGIDVLSNHEECKANVRRFLDRNGQITRLCYLNEWVGGFREKTTYIMGYCGGGSYCNGSIKLTDLISARDATIIIGALFGIDEIPMTLTDDMVSEMSLLRQDF